ncbi:hypothetical protein DPMN_093260 [Dreissena polymorpha]|uniref:Uncharacterized protein n=1 Tax=Dreissena polymorpha TaxID=45954 RepID=A0A9D4R1P7_DREPO|nr:hypothetical protein DPMN_093260 [Dreissena polymorpha]
MAAADVKPQEIQMENITLMKDNTKIKRYKEGVVYHHIPDTDVVDADTSDTNTQPKNGGKKLLSIIIITFLIN